MAVSILIAKDDVEDDFATKKIDLKAQNRSLLDEGDVRLTNIRAKTTGLVVVDDAITTRLKPGGVYTHVATKEYVTSVSWYRKEGTQTTTQKTQSSLSIDDDELIDGRRIEIMNISARVPEYIQVGRRVRSSSSR